MVKRVRANFIDYSGAIIEDEEPYELSLIIARATPLWSAFQVIFLAQIALYMHIKNWQVRCKIMFEFGQTRRSTAFQNACNVEKHKKNDLKSPIFSLVKLSNLQTGIKHTCDIQ